MQIGSLAATGLTRQSFIPAAMQASRAPGIPVRAKIGAADDALPEARINLAAVAPSSSGMNRSMRMAQHGVSAAISTAR
jgi:hypothetical protein